MEDHPHRAHAHRLVGEHPGVLVLGVESPHDLLQLRHVHPLAGEVVPRPLGDAQVFLRSAPAGLEERLLLLQLASGTSSSEELVGGRRHLGEQARCLPSIAHIVIIPVRPEETQGSEGGHERREERSPERHVEREQQEGQPEAGEDQADRPVPTRGGAMRRSIGGGGGRAGSGVGRLGLRTLLDGEHLGRVLVEGLLRGRELGARRVDRAGPLADRRGVHREPGARGREPVLHVADRASPGAGRDPIRARQPPSEALQGGEGGGIDGGQLRPLGQRGVGLREGGAQVAAQLSSHRARPFERLDLAQHVQTRPQVVVRRVRPHCGGTLPAGQASRARRSSSSERS